MRKFSREILEERLQRTYTLTAPQLQLWDTVYNKLGEELVVINVCLHHGVNYNNPTWTYRAAPIDEIKIGQDGFVFAPQQVHIRGDEIGRNIFLSEDEIIQTDPASYYPKNYDETAVLNGITAKFNELYA